jgi:hypothetical protein
MRIIPIRGEGCKYVIGCDPASRVDFAGVVVNEPEGSGRTMIHTVRHIERMRGLTYPLLAQKLKILVERLQPDERATLRRIRPAEVVIALDATGAGIPIADMFREADLRARLVEISFTSGQETRQEGGGGAYYVPKKTLIGGLGLVVETGRLVLAEGMKFADVLRREFESFTQTLSASGRSTFEAASGAHDDLLSALAMSVFLAEKEGGSGGWTVESGGVPPTRRELGRWF